MITEEQKEKNSKIFDKSEYIILPERTHGKHSFPDLYVAKYRLRADNFVREKAKSLGFRVKNAGRGLNGKTFIGEINWDQALKLNLALWGETLTLRRFIDFKELLEYGLQGGKVYHGTGKKIDDLREIREIYDDLFAKKDPLRQVHLDAYFVENESGKLTINYSHYLENRKLVPRISEELEDCIMESEGLRSISFNPQGLPFYKEEIIYWHPIDNSVAGFCADSGWADLDCDGNPLDSVPSLGVQHARKNF